MSGKRDVDALIITQLKQLGCQVDDSVTAVADIDKFTLYRATVICLKVIAIGNNREPDDYPEELPAEISQCFRTCTSLTQAIKVRGLSDDLNPNNPIF